MSLKSKWKQLDQSYLITAKFLYFTLNLEMYAFYIYRSIFITTFLKVPVSKYGVIASLMACVSFPFMTIWGTLADSLGRHKLVLACLSLLTAGSFELLYFRFEEGSTRQFAYVLSVLAMFSAFSSGLQPLLDTLVLRLLSSNPAFSKELYGRQRMWGTISYCFVTMVAASLMDRLGQQILFVIMPASALIFAVTLFLGAPPDQPKSIRQMIDEHRDAKAKKTGDKAVSVEGARSHGRSPIIVLLTDPGYLFFLLAVFMTGLARATMTNFLSLFWKKDMHLTNKQIGGAAIAGVVLEVFIFFFAARFAFLGNYWMLLLAQLSMALRSWFYAVMPDSPAWYPAVLANELFKGTAFGFTHLAGVKTAAAAAPPGLQATSQAIYNSIYAQLPAVIAAFVGAQLYDRWDAHVLFTVVAIISTVSCVAFMAKYVFDGSISVCGLRVFRPAPKAGNVAVSADTVAR